jgi:protein SCO1/2
MSIWVSVLMLLFAYFFPAPRVELEEALVTAWIAPDNRSRFNGMDIRYTDQDGQTGVLASLMNKPVVIAFFYTRCQTAAKCSMTVSRMAMLQQTLRDRHLESRARLLAITYEPQFDTSERLHRFGADRGLAFGPDAKALRIEADDLRRLVDMIEAPVNYNAGWVNTHGVELTLFDGRGGLVRRYHTVGWTNAAVATDLKRVILGK